MAKEIEKMSADVEMVSKLSDQPNRDDGLTAEELKAVFDRGPARLKEYVNDTLVPAHNDLVQQVSDLEVSADQTGQAHNDLAERVGDLEESTGQSLFNVNEMFMALKSRVATLENSTGESFNEFAEENAALSGRIDNLGQAMGQGFRQVNEAVNDLDVRVAELEKAPGGGGTGADGFSPAASVTQTDTGAVIAITDKNGTTTATIANGKDGADSLACNRVLLYPVPVGETTTRMWSELSRTPKVGEVFNALCGTYYTVFEVTDVKGSVYTAKALASTDLSGEPGAVQTVNGVSPDENGNVEIPIPDSSQNGDYSSVEPAYDDIPKVFFGGALQQTKDEAVVPFRYISKTDDFSGYAEIKAQGNSSMNYPKKNQTVKMFADEACDSKMKKDFKGWGKQNKHVYKANWIDLTHARNIVSARLWADVVKSRANYMELPELLRTTPSQGAVDGFPVKVYADGVYQGRYTLNIPKDKWAFNMDDELDEHCVLCGENYVSGCFRASAQINESDWTDEIHDVVPTSIKTRWNQVISFVMNSTDEDFRANLSQYFYVDSLIDYYLFGLASCGLDAFGKNQIYATYDGQRWIASMYDMDSTWGLYWNGSKFVANDYARTSYEDFADGRQGNLLYIRLEQLFSAELQTRWTELRAGALSIENIINRFERFTDIASAELVKEDYSATTGGGKFTGIPGQTTNNIQQIRAFALARLTWTDEYVTGLTGESGGEDPDVPDHTHSYTSEVTTEPTCETAGVRTYTCSCGDTYTDEIAATGHNYVDGTCANCGAGVSLYSMPSATTFDGTNYIDTEVQLFAEDKPFTVMFDWEDTDECEFNGSSHVVLHSMKEVSPWPGLTVGYHHPADKVFVVEINQTTNNVVAIKSDGIAAENFVRTRFAILKNADGTVIVRRRHNDSAQIHETILTGTSFVAHTMSLLIGCYQATNGTKGRFAKGIMHRCVVYDYAVSDATITEFLNA